MAGDTVDSWLILPKVSKLALHLTKTSFAAARLSHRPRGQVQIPDIIYQTANTAILNCSLYPAKKQVGCFEASWLAGSSGPSINSDQGRTQGTTSSPAEPIKGALSVRAFPTAVAVDYERLHGTNVTAIILRITLAFLFRLLHRHDRGLPF